MQKHLSVLAIAISCIAVSCTSKNDGGLSPTAQKNLDAMHGVTNTFQTKDFSKLGDYIAADAVDHAGENGDIKGVDSMKAAFAKYAAQMDNEKATVIKELADDEYVMSWMHFEGNYKTAGMGHKAGDKFDMKSIEMARFKDGKAVEHWTMMDPNDLMKMMASTQPQMATPADSTVKKK
ncbi:MAG TPA: ester cyclase [Puia sp.]|nr:ester cyclase [Puia sp.]